MKTGMTDLKREKPKKSDMEQTTASPGYSYEKYSYGTRICLGTEELEKLGIDVTDLRAGQSVTIKGKCEVCQVSNEERMDDKGKPKQDQRLEIQIQKLALAAEDSFKSGFDDEDEK